MITHLLYKPGRYKPMLAVDRLRINKAGIVGAASASALRQLLLVPQSTLDQFSLMPGDLRENVVLGDPTLAELHNLPSGTVLKIGSVRLRLTFHCEPCARLKDVVDTKAILHRRGYLATVLEAGELVLGQRVDVLPVAFESIPYETLDRIEWYMGRVGGSIPVTTLVHEVGLSLSYCRAIPTILKSHPDLLGRVTFRGKRLRDVGRSAPEEARASADQTDLFELEEGVVESLDFIPGAFVVYLRGSRSFTVPLQTVPALLAADAWTRKQWEPRQGGTILRWPDLGFEVSVAQLLGVGE